MDMIKTPRVSVRIPAYNHEKYIRECLDSVLSQTFQDFEIVITDDGSADKTAEIIQSYKDPRIKLEIFDKNRGCSAAAMNCVERATGEYIANLCSDDAWEPDKLEKQVRFLDDNPQYDAVFTKVRLIDEDSKEIVSGKGSYMTVFEKENRSKEQWLKYFFFYGNCLCIPSVLIRRDVYKALNYQDRRLASLNDFDLWVRFCMTHELFIIDEKLINFRLRANEANASGNRIENHIRHRFEYKQIMNHFLMIRGTEQLQSVFGDVTQYGEPADELIPYFLGRLACDTRDNFKQLWGLETIFNMMKDESLAKLLESRCGFSYTSFHALAASKDVFDLALLRKQNKDIEENRALIDLQQAKIQSLETELGQVRELNAGQEKKLGVMETELGQVRELNAGQEKKLESMDTEMAQASECITSSKKIIASLTEDVCRLQKENAEHIRKEQRLSDEIATMKNTLSWRLTKPLREMRAIQRHIVGKSHKNLL